MQTGLILFAHGARDPRWAAPFEAVAARLRKRHPQAQVRLAFLELMTPDLQTAGLELAAGGCARIEVLPMFLGAGGHVRKDLPLLIEQLRASCPQVAVSLHGAIGEIDSVVDAMVAVAEQLIEGVR